MVRSERDQRQRERDESSRREREVLLMLSVSVERADLSLCSQIREQLASSLETNRRVMHACQLLTGLLGDGYC